jgi:hypothetical protein
LQEQEKGEQSREKVQISKELVYEDAEIKNDVSQPKESRDSGSPSTGTAANKAKEP